MNDNIKFTVEVEQNNMLAFLGTRSEGRRLNKGEGLSESNKHSPAFELGIKPRIRTQMMSSEDPLAKSRKFDIIEGG